MLPPLSILRIAKRPNHDFVAVNDAKGTLNEPLEQLQTDALVELTSCRKTVRLDGIWRIRYTESLHSRS
jgi:hypothetical protein